MANVDEITTNEIMEFLKEHMVMKEELNEELINLEDRMTRKMGQSKLDIIDAMDDKLASLKGDLVVLMRKEDSKVLYLIKLLHEKKFLAEEEVKELLKMEPFPRMVL